jgi:hypothetical protein
MRFLTLGFFHVWESEDIPAYAGESQASEEKEECHPHMLNLQRIQSLRTNSILSCENQS